MDVCEVMVCEGQQIPEDVLAEVEEAAKYPVVPDDDCPEITEKEARLIASMVQQRKNARKIAQ